MLTKIPLDRPWIPSPGGSIYQIMQVNAERSVLPGKGDLVLRAFPQFREASSERAASHEAADRVDWPSAIARISDQDGGDVTGSAPVCGLVGVAATAATVGWFSI